MGSLTEISVVTRKSIIFITIAVIILILIRLSIKVGIDYWKATHPVPIPPPNVFFGKIPSPKFPQSATTSSNLKFTLENIEGRPPETTSAGRVYAIIQKTPTILSSQRAKAFASKLGFKNEPEIISPTYYKFINDQDKLLTLEIDIVTMNFKLKYDYTKNPQIFYQGNIRSKDQAINDVKSYVGNNGLFDSFTLNGKITGDLLKFDMATKTFSPASSLSNTDAIRVNFFRSDLDGLKVLPPKFNKSLTYVIYSAASSNNWKYPEIIYTYWPIDYSSFATYPLRSATTAWQNLIDGEATIIDMGRNNPDNIIIRNIYLAYYDSEEPQLYLQPIFVFEGDNNFVAYLPAVDNQWLD